jgi:site-specific DNA-methyltransferase (adenine-specific)
MIIPARWYAGGKGLDEFRMVMLNDTSLRCIVDYPASSDCFPGVQIKGGVCYFLWNRDGKGLCEVRNVRLGVISILTRPLLEKGISSFIRYNEAVSIYYKVGVVKEKSFSKFISSRKPFGIATDVDFRKTSEGEIKIYGNKAVHYLNKAEVSLNKDWIDKYKILISYAYGAGEDFPHQIINKPFLSLPGEACTETYLVVYPSNDKKEVENVLSYMRTRFFRFLVMLIKNTQHATRSVYSFVPMQDFSKPWVDEELYKKYNLTTDEIKFIESMIKPME